MIRILFVCHGNICRSPMAEFIMKKIVRREGREERFEIASAGTSDEEEGNGVYPLARQELARHGIGCPGHRARQVTPDDYHRFDLIVGMEQANLDNLLRLFGGDPDGKLSLLLDHTGHPRDVADPWYTRDFATAWANIHEGCNALFLKLDTDERDDA